MGQNGPNMKFKALKQHCNFEFSLLIIGINKFLALSLLILSKLKLV